MIWRWDQGRASYFTFSNIQNISRVLVRYNGALMQTVDSSFRDDLMNETGLPFAPSHYTIKRNYKRVFECSMLASYVGNRLIVSDICRAIAAGYTAMQDVDGYLYEVERRFRYPYPAFDNYSDVKGICFPYLAMLKLLFAKAIKTGDGNQTLTLEEIGSHLIVNNVTGLEDLNFYWDIEGHDFSFQSYSSSDQKRQVREMMAFIGQHSFLQYKNGILYLVGMSADTCESIFDALQPFDTTLFSRNPVDDFMKLTSYTMEIAPASIAGEFENEVALEAFEVEEGKKVFVSHFAIERDPRLRKAYLQLHPDPICDVCNRNMHIVYPWTENMLEVHHLKPLSSFSEQGHKTKVQDVVGLCPSCHRAVHLYYKCYLKERNSADFTSNDEAMDAYIAAKERVKK